MIAVSPLPSIVSARHADARRVEFGRSYAPEEPNFYSNEKERGRAPEE
jgi:hypothetical protein